MNYVDSRRTNSLQSRSGRRTPRIVVGVAGSLLCLSASIAAPFANNDLVSASPGSSYDLASLQGRYSLLTTTREGESPSAGGGIVDFDGKGGFTSFGVLNVSSPVAGQRIISEVFSGGTYSVNPDGSGQTITQSGSSSHFVITEAREIGGQLVASSIHLCSDALDPVGEGLAVSELSRLPSGGTVQTASISGNFAVRGLGFGGRSPVGIMAMMNFDGKGAYAANSQLNQDMYADPCQRELLEVPDAGSYSIGTNGLGTIMTANLGAGVIVPLRAKPDPGAPSQEITEFGLIFDTLGPMSGSLVVVRASKLPN